MGEKKIGGLNVGTSLVLVTIVLLLIITFATLSYVSAKTDLDLTMNALEEEERYNQASNKAQCMAADINEQLINGQYDGYIDERGNISYSVDIDESRVLYVELHVEEGTDKVTTITSWSVEKTLSDDADDMDEPMNLLF